mmetsp:Transcript_12188/g.24614  ORF Transcript_12188/g.24614 Transcript_12188/m.24614 type:complete len:222 (-) Transcript_12188:51-716(-)
MRKKQTPTKNKSGTNKQPTTTPTPSLHQEMLRKTTTRKRKKKKYEKNIREQRRRILAVPHPVPRPTPSRIIVIRWRPPKHVPQVRPLALVVPPSPCNFLTPRGRAKLHPPPAPAHGHHHQPHPLLDHHLLEHAAFHRVVGAGVAACVAWHGHDSVVIREVDALGVVQGWLAHHAAAAAAATAATAAAALLWVAALVTKAATREVMCLTSRTGPVSRSKVAH